MSWPVLQAQLILGAFLILAGFVRTDVAWAQSCSVNAITAENCLTGNPASEWDIVGAGDPTIQGFATDISVNRGNTISFKIDTDATAYRLDIYRLGYYGGMGARKVATVLPSASLPQAQPACLVQGSTGLVDCGNWSVSASWNVPSNATSGIYFAKVIRTDTGGASHIVFIVRNDSSTSDIIFKTSDTTWQAYNDYGGNSLYVGAPVGRAYKVSYNRPFVTRGNQYARAWLFGAEYPMVRWLEANGYDVTYFTSVDADRIGSLIPNHRTFLSVGHDEYWSAGARANVEAARNAGVHLAFFSGNEIFWKTRWENSIDGSNTSYRTLVTYKETHANAKIDPDAAWTGTWRDPRFSPPADGNRPENALSGQIFTVNCCDPNSPGIKVPADDGRMRFWRNTSVATLSPGQTATLAAGTLGYEWDEDLDNGFRPPGSFRLSSTTVPNVSYLQDYGTTYASGTATHTMTMYRHSSGALVFGAGTIRWSWGLDTNHDPDPATPGHATSPDVRMRQATVNLLADMGVQPGSLQPGLVAASQSTDTARPVAVIVNPAAGATPPAGQQLLISGTATDSGGQVAGVEVSVDNGATWHRADGRANWTYAWTPSSPGTVTIRVRAVDDSGNLQNPDASRTVTVGAETCPCSFWDPGVTPAIPADDSDSNPVELGVKFRSDVNGTITGIRFYKGPGNTGTHIGNLWTASGQLLASATFTNETATGWQQVNFSTPVPIVANTVYVASYFAPNGHYSVNGGFLLNSGVDRGVLHLLQNGVSGGNGVYTYSATSAFPSSSYNGNYYWVDVVFSDEAGPPDTTPPTITGRTPAAGANDVSVGTSVNVTFSEAMNAGTIDSTTFELRDASNTLVSASVSYNASTLTATLTPNQPLAAASTYTARVRGGTTDPRVKDLAGNALASTSTWTFTTAAPGECPCSAWDSSAVPAILADPDTGSVELGVKFRTDVPGTITGIRFFKGAGNTGTHVGNLWTTSGQLLASATFTNETGSGWQQVTFPTPVPIAANTIYVASYFAPNGHYSVDGGFFNFNGVDNGFVHLLRTDLAGGNGVYAYATSSTFPATSFNGNNYWVDIVFMPDSGGPSGDTTPPTITERTPASGATEVPAGASVTVTFSEAVDPATITTSTIELREGTTLVPSSVSYDSATWTATLTPNAPLTAGATFTATVRGGTTDPRVKDFAGNALAASSSWSFTTSNRQDHINGVWSPVANWPLIAIHAVLTPDGRVLTYGTTGTGQQTGFFIYDVWNPAAGLSGGHVTLPNSTGTDLFCSSQLVLAQSGNIFLAGGDNWTGTGTTNTGNNNTNIFSPSNNSLARAGNMNRARWYSTATTLPNGEIYIQGGTSGEDRPEIRDALGSFRLLSGVNTSNLSAMYPRNWVAPDGRIFGFDNAGRMYYVTTEGSGTIQSIGQLPGSTSWTGSAVMYRPGKIIQMGGGSSAALTIDINGPVPIVQSTQSMNTRRQWVTATVLADGHVLATGGSEIDNQLVNVNNSAAIWDPDAGTWHIGSSGARARLYHSTALLLPDATVLIAGGGAPGPLVNTNAEIYTPPYLFDANGELAPRPQIESSPDEIDIGEDFFVTYSNASSISRVSLIKTGSVTHSWNMDQRYLELPFTASGNTLEIQAPTRASDAPPGYYLLFLINNQGVPSVGRIVRINIQGIPNVSADYTPSVGSATTGNAFTLSCNEGEVLVGVHGRAGTGINQIGPRCVAINQNMQWVGSPVNRGAAGSSSGGTAFTRTCPTNRAISAFRGRASSTTVNQLDFECRAINSSGQLTGSGSYLGAVGGTSGSAVGPYNCTTNHPGSAIYGRASSSAVVNFGLMCRRPPVADANTPPTITNPGTLSGVVGTAVSRQIGASDADNDPLTFSATGLPNGLTISTSGLITGTPTTAGSFAVTVTVSDGTAQASTNFTWNISGAQQFVLNPLPPTSPALAGASVAFTASSQNGVNVQYKWFFDDGTPETPYSSSPTINHTFAQPGIYYVTVTAIADGATAQSQTVTQIVHLPLTANRPAASANIAFGPGGTQGRIWVVNQDNDSVSAFDVATNTRLAEITVGTDPRSVAIAPDGRVWVTNKTSATISVVDPALMAVTQTISLPRASQPFGLVFSPTGNAAYVALEALGRVVRLDPSSGSQLASLNTGPDVRHLSVNHDGTELYVSRFVTPPLPGEDTANVQTSVGGVEKGGEVIVVATGSMTAVKTIVLRHSDEVDSEISGGGVPNYLGAAAFSPDNTMAWVPSKQDNIRRGTLRNGQNLNFQNTVRAIASRINLATDSEVFAGRMDLDNSSVASAAIFDRYGVYLFVALETSREVAIIDAHRGLEIFRFDVGRAPQGLALSANGTRLYVNNFMDRTVGVYDVTPLINDGQSNVPLIATLNAIGTEKLSPTVLLGKQLFYDARDPRLARDRYLSCASCHNDGGSDGRVWDLTGMGEGLRNTISLRGRAGAHGLLHWSANFDEVQDFEGQIRTLAGGTGLMTDAQFNAGTRSQPLGDPKTGVSADLDALAAYLQSLTAMPASPYRNNDGSMTAEATEGKALFESNGCMACHSGTSLTDSAPNKLHNIGTLKPSSGNRLGGPLTGIDTPTLRDAWATAPYLHDGSAATIADAIRAHNNVSISEADLAKVVAFIEQVEYETVGANIFTAFDPSATPAILADTDTGAVELGVKFLATTDGFITGIRFYKGPGNTGTHVGSLWTSTGTLLARATFTNETATGWQQVNFDTPVPITANTVYVASYHAPVGRYSANVAFFAGAPVVNGPLRLLQEGESGGNGVYMYSASPAFPANSYNSNNYWVDVVFTN